MARVVPDWVRKAAANKALGLKHGFRSGLEEKLGKAIEAQGQPVRFETFKIPYRVPETRHTYCPDFLLTNGILVEAKGIFDSTDRAKHLFVRAQYPDLDIRFVFTRSASPINPGSKTTLAEWCVKHGYQFADKMIPVSWFSETGPEFNPLEVIADGPYGYVERLKKG
jgi:hypothetical protein